MIERIDLLPHRYRALKAQRRNVAIVVGVGVILAGLLGLWWMSLSSSINEERDNLAVLDQRAAGLQSEVAALQRFADLEREVNAKRAALQQVMAGDLAWPALLTDVAMVIPGEAWLTTLTASAGVTEGATPVGTEGAPIRISNETPTGRVQFSGQAVSLPGVADWLVRLAKVDGFQAIWLNSASGGATGAGEGEQELFTFDSTLELGEEALSDRFTQVAP